MCWPGNMSHYMTENGCHNFVCYVYVFPSLLKKIGTDAKSAPKLQLLPRKNALFPGIVQISKSSQYRSGKVTWAFSISSFLF